MRSLLLLFALAPLSIAADSPSSCAPCHPSQTSQFLKTGMANALLPPKSTEILSKNAKLSAKIGIFGYEIRDFQLSLTSPNRTTSVPITWSFGAGTVGQTWLYQRDGRWYESRVSYFSALHNLDLTIGHPPDPGPDPLGRPIPESEAKQCFSCHATGDRPGIQCERCHVGEHGKLPKLGKLTPEAMSDLCGQCHRTWAQIAANGPRGVANVRFQPYRLALSKCYDAEDLRIRCTACHDPHRPLETAAAAYDSKCASCHTSKKCTVASKDCVTCHMPKVELPGAHFKFTDHRIRIARPNEPYPD